MLTRRFFLGGLASAFALGPRRIFAAAPGAFTGGKPALTFGALSDVHVCLAPGGEKLRDAYDTRTLEAAFTWFRDQGVDAVLIAGDMAHSGLAAYSNAIAFSGHSHTSLTDERATAPSTFRLACSRVPARGTFEVRAISCWGKKSAPLRADFA